MGIIHSRHNKLQVFKTILTQFVYYNVRIFKSQGNKKQLVME